MDVFFVDGAVRSFADIILQQRIDGKKCLVASYGFGVAQVKKILNAFDFVLLIADVSHAQLNTDAYNTVVEMSAVLPNFSFIATKTHAKFALIDDETIIFTSANLSANRRMESYMIGSIREVSGVQKINEIFSENDGVVENLIVGSMGVDAFNIVKAKYFDIGGLNEPSYTHVIDD